MTTEYLYTITARCPLELVDDANHLACVLGTSMADLNTYGNENFVGYSVVSFAAKEDTLATVQIGSLTRPEFDTEEQIDMEAAQRAFEAMVVLFPGLSDEEGNPVDQPDYTGENLVAVVGTGPMEAIQLLGLTPVPSDE